jgi:hypothetical protein
MPSFSNINSIDNSFPSAETFTQRLETLEGQMPPMLDDFSKYYVFYNKNPENSEYQQFFNNIKSNLNTLNSQLFMVSNDVVYNTQQLNEKLHDLDEAINKEKKTNRKLKKNLGIVENKNSAAAVLITNYKQMYDYGYLRNWGLVISIIIAGFTISKVYSNKILIK